MFLFGGRPLTLPNRTLQLSVIQPLACTFDGGCTTYSYCLRPTDEIIFTRFWRVQGAALVAVRLLWLCFYLADGHEGRTLQLSVIQPLACTFDGGCTTYSYCLRPTDEIIFARFWHVQGAALVAVRLLLEYFLFGRPLATVIILCIRPFVAVMFLFGGRPLTIPSRTLQADGAFLKSPGCTRFAHLVRGC